MEEIDKITTCGAIRGLMFEEHCEYRGIRYAFSKRFEYPVQVTSWNGIYNATEFGACAYQRRSFEDDAVCNQFYHKEFRDGMTFTYSEDCLFLNIWSPVTPQNCPVLIYIHGGSFTGGSSNEGHISGAEFAKNGVIFISFNYRLGPFGFCSHPDLKDKQGRCGNFGLYDQYTAIKWVRENIGDYGGNPDKITLMGQSAGSMSVDIHSSSKLERGWFSGIIMSSCLGLQRYIVRPLKPDKTLIFWKKVIANAQVNTIDELRTIDPKILYYAWYDACKYFRFSIKYTFPVYDGSLLTKQSFRMKQLADVPYLIGMTADDLMPPVLLRIIRKWGMAALKNKNKCYSYFFARRLPGDEKGAWHSSDLLYFFSTLKNNWRPFTAEDYRLSNQMSDVITAFTRNGDPRCKAVPDWEAGNNLPMVFSRSVEQKKMDIKQLIKNTFTKGKTK